MHHAVPARLDARHPIEQPARARRALEHARRRIAAFRPSPQFNPQPKDHSPEQLIVWDVEGGGEAGSRRFRIRRLGLRAEETLGAGMIGKTMDEVVPPSLRDHLAGRRACDCAASGSAIYAIITTITNGHQVDCERLLLPFGEGDTVEQIVASLQLISFQGPIDRREISRDFEMRSQMPRSPAASTRTGPCEIPEPSRHRSRPFVQAAALRRPRTAAGSPTSGRQAAGGAAQGLQDRKDLLRKIQRGLHRAGDVRDRRIDRARRSDQRAGPLHARARNGIRQPQVRRRSGARTGNWRPVRLSDVRSVRSIRPKCGSGPITSSASAGP